MPIYTDNKTKRLYIEFQYKGHRHKERLPEGTTKKDAERLEVKIKADLMFQSHGIETQTSVVTFRHFVEYTFGHVADNFPKQRREHTQRIVKAAYVFFRDKPMRSIKAADIERFKASRVNLITIHDRPRKPASVEREMSILSSIFSMAVKNDVIDYNPCSRVKKLHFDNRQDRILQYEDEAKFFEHLKTDWAKDVCRMALYAGLRQNDILHLTRFQIDLANNRIVLVQGKTKRHHIVAMLPIVREIIERRLQKKGEYLFPSPSHKKGIDPQAGRVRHSMLRACEKAKIPHLTIRDLRRTCATRLGLKGASSVAIAEVLGHSGLRIVQRYVRSEEVQRNALELLVNPAIDSPLPKSSNVKLLKRKG